MRQLDALRTEKKQYRESLIYVSDGHGDAETQKIGKQNDKNLIIMKKFIMSLFGIEATASKINGRKSNGVEDASGYKNWRADIHSANDSSLN